MGDQWTPEFWGVTVWVPKYCLGCVNRLKKEWVAVCIDSLLGRNSVKWDTVWNIAA